MDTDGNVTVLLRRWSENHDGEALSEVLPALLEELRELARGYLAREAGQRTLQPTELVNETCLRLLERRVGKIGSRSQFFAFTARLMRQILVDRARSRRSEKRGGNVEHAHLDEALNIDGSRGDPEKILAVHEILQRLARIDEVQHQVAEMRYFVGLTVPEIAQALGISVATVERRWEAARRWLAYELR
jgi:RNA polymerase sigma factor (TIGR02999 family)